MKDFKKIDEEFEFSDAYELLADNVKTNVDFLIEEYKFSLVLGLAGCESPIEQILSLYLNESLGNFTCFESDIELLGLSKQEDIYIKDKRYRVDFLLELALKKHGRYIKVVKLIIECDGHDFHEKTKEQVKKTNERIRDLQNEGYEVLRFSGSEIHNNPHKCILDIKKFIYSKHKREVQ